MQTEEDDEDCVRRLRARQGMASRRGCDVLMLLAKERQELCLFEV